MALDVNPFADYGNLDFATTDNFKDIYQVFVELGTNGQIAKVSAPASNKVYGVLRDTCRIGETPAVRTHYVTYIFAGADLKVGEYVTNDAEGKAVPAKEGEPVLGQVLEINAKAGKEAKINLLLQPIVTAPAPKA